MSKFNLIRGRISQKLPKLAIRHRVVLLPMLIALSLVLSACQVYNGYPTVTPPPTTVAVNSPSPSDTTLPDYPTPTPELPFPTVTPRPTLPIPPSNVASRESKVIQAALADFFNNFYRRLSSADIYEVGLDGLISYLKQQGIANPQVPKPNFTNNQASDEKLFFQSYFIALSHYQSQVDEQKMAYAIVNAETNALNECSTAFYPSDQAQDYVDKLSNQYSPVGIGVIILPSQNGLVVWHVTPGSPAEQSGLKIGDTIVTVNGTTLKGMAVGAMAQLLRGGSNPQANSQVTVQVQRAGASQNQQITLKRAKITTPPIETQLINNDTGYIRINIFPIGTADEVSNFFKQLDNAISQFNNQQVKGIVVDLRNNQYGVIRIIQEALSRFATRNPMMYLQTTSSIIGSSDNSTATAQASTPISNTVVGFPNSQDVQPVKKPLALLIDQSTSGGAEVFALGLQGQQNVQLFGSETASCSTVASPLVLSDKSILSVASYKPIKNPQDPTTTINSVTPDVSVALDINSLQQGHDTQLDKAVQYIEGS